MYYIMPNLYCPSYIYYYLFINNKIWIIEYKYYRDFVVKGFSIKFASIIYNDIPLIYFMRLFHPFILDIIASFLVVLITVACSSDREEYYPKGVVFPDGADIDKKVEMASRVVPTEQQLQWQDRELIAFLNFGINTFTDKETGDGSDDPTLFNPENLDTRQWVRTLKEVGFKMVILTAKYNDGFCLWPTATTDYSVASSPWKSGQGDIVAELRKACDEYGLGIGLYLSPYDRNASMYGDSQKYNDFYISQLRELLTNYGKIDEVWFDGSIGEGPNGKKQEYDWERIRAVVKELQPEAVTAIMGDDVRWVGNRGGVGRTTEWSVTALSPSILFGGTARNDSLEINDMSVDLGSRDLLARTDRVYWWPSEVDASIRPGWFFHESESPKSLRDLVNIYLTSVGRNSVLSLNIPPDRRGRIAYADSVRLIEMRRWIDSAFAESLVDEMGLPLGNDCVTVNCVVVEEDITKGQRVEEFKVMATDKDGYNKELTSGTTIGRKRILTFAPSEICRIWIEIDKHRGDRTHIRPIKAYLIDLPHKEVHVEQVDTLQIDSVKNAVIPPKLS